METIIWFIIILILILITLFMICFIALICSKSLNKYSEDNEINLSNTDNCFKSNDDPIKYD